MVDIEVEENNEYYGPLYIGSLFEYAHMVYDTTSTWTAVLVSGGRGSTMTSDYDPLRSNTDSSIYHDIYNSETGETNKVHE